MADKKQVYIAYQTGWSNISYWGTSDPIETYLMLYAVTDSRAAARKELQRVVLENEEAELDDNDYYHNGVGWYDVMQVDSKQLLGVAFNPPGGSYSSVNIEMETFDTDKELADWLWEHMDDNINYDNELGMLHFLYNDNTATFLRFVKELEELEEGDNSGDSVQWYNLDELRKDGDYTLWVV